jgi:hypothetical protein
MFNPTTAQQLNTEVYNHMARHIHVSAFFLAIFREVLGERKHIIG